MPSHPQWFPWRCSTSRFDLDPLLLQVRVLQELRVQDFRLELDLGVSVSIPFFSLPPEGSGRTHPDSPPH